MSRALAWFRRAADAGMADSQFAMGQMNALGVGTARNQGRALTWFQMAEKQGHNDAGRQAARLREEGVTAEAPGPQPPIPSDPLEQAPLAETQSAEAAPAQASPQADAPAPVADSPVADSPVAEPAEPQAPLQEAAVPSSAATPPAATPPAATPPATTLGGSSLWLGSFASQEAASVFLEKTQDLYAEVFSGKPLAVEPVDSSRFRVSARGFPDSAAAVRFCAQLKDRIENAFCAVIAP